jgi:Ca-activated chloride channel homolog
VRHVTRSGILAAGAGIVILCGCLRFAQAQSGRDGARVTLTPRSHPERRTGLANTIRLDVKLVLIPVTVTDTFGHPRSGLPKTAFRLLEEGVEQNVSYFATEDAPISLGLVFDASGSMQHKLDKSRAAVAQIFQASMPGDEFFLVEFNDSPRVLCDFTSHAEEIQNTLAFIRPKGWTALFDAVYLAVHRMKQARNPRKALVILSDGGDNNSRYTEPEIKDLVREADVSIYSLGILGPGTTNHTLRCLRTFAEETGGRMLTVDKLSELPEAVEKMNAALRNQYVLGFSSTNDHSDGKYRKVEVKLDQQPGGPPLHASWRVGYYAPTGQ